MIHKGRKTMNGRSVVIFDTEGLNIADVVDQMTSDGWRFSRITVAYTAKDGSRKEKHIPAEHVAGIFSKYGFSTWSFEASNGPAALSGTMNCDKGAAAITSSKGGGINYFAEIAPAAAPVDDGWDAFSDAGGYDDGYGGGYDDGYGNAYPAGPDRNAYGNAAASALYGDDDADVIPGMTQAERSRNRDVNRQETIQQLDHGKRSKHTLYIVLAIIELLCIAPFVFAIFALIDTVKGRKALDYDIRESEHYFREARWLLIVGGVAAIVLLGILIWKFGSLLPFMS